MDSYLKKLVDAASPKLVAKIHGLEIYECKEMEENQAIIIQRNPNPKDFLNDLLTVLNLEKGRVADDTHRNN